MADVLVLGRLGYHETNIVDPILQALEDRGHGVARAGGSFDFFDPHTDQAVSVCQSLAVNLSHYDSVFFVDWWNFALPLVLYRCQGGEVPRLTGFNLGTVKLPHDLARQIPHAADYERFLLATYDGILCHSQWHASLMGYQNCIVTGYPLDRQIERHRPILGPVRRVIYPHRWALDKGCDRFLRFVAAVKARGLESEWVFIVTDPTERPLLESLGITVTPRLSQHELRQLCQVGGYVWAWTRSETCGYSVYDLVSYGLTPLLDGLGVWGDFPARFRNLDIDSAIELVERGDTLTNDEWHSLLAPHKDNAQRIAAAITGEHFARTAAA